MKAPVTVTCLFVRGEYPYTPEFVERLYAMVHRWIDRPFRFVCLTDQPWLFSEPIETVPVSRLPGFAPWTKLELFNPDRQWTGRVLYFDLDVLIVAELGPIIDAPAPFAITDDRTGRRGRDAFKREIVRRFNSSVMVWDGGTQTHLYTSFRPAVAERLSGDQDHIGLQSPEAFPLPRAWFPRLSEIGPPPWPEAKVILSKVPKNDQAVAQFPWFAPLWGAA